MITAIAADTLARVYYGLPLPRATGGGRLTSWTHCVRTGLIHENDLTVTALGVAMLLEFIAKRRQA